MEIEKKSKINQRLLALMLVLLIITCGHLFYQQEQFKRQQLQWQNQLRSLQQNFQQWQNNQLNYELTALNTAHALIIQADVNLQSKQNLTLILNSLKAAAQQVSAFHDAKIILLQQALQMDILALQQIPSVNLIDLAHQMNNLNGKISTLKFLELEMPTPTTNVNAKNDAWKNLRVALSHVVSVQHIDTAEVPFLSMQQKIAVQQYLRELLQQVWWAAIQHDNTIYQASLEDITLTLNRYAINGTQSFQPMLSDLQKINVTQTWPTQLHSAMVLPS